MCLFPLGFYKDNMSLYSQLFFCIYHATVCLSSLIIGNQDFNVFVIPMCTFFLCLSTHLTYDMCENEASRMLMNLLKATELFHGKFSVF